MGEISDIVDKNLSNEENNVNLIDMLGIVESPQKEDSLEEKMDSQHS